MPLVELCAFTVPGRAEPKGSVSAYNDRFGVARVKFGSTTKRKDGSRADGPARYAAWCRQVAASIWAWKVRFGRREPFAEPLEVWAWFYLPRPKSVTREHPTGPPDADKLFRAVGDVLEKSELITNDSIIIAPHPRKLYCPPGVEPYASVLIKAIRKDVPLGND